MTQNKSVKEISFLLKLYRNYQSQRRIIFQFELKSNDVYLFIKVCIIPVITDRYV